MPAPRLTILALVALLALTAGCGTDDEQAVRDTLTKYANAVAGKDYQTICDDLFSERLIEKLRNVNLPCETALRSGFEDVKDPRITVKSVKVDGDTAEAVARTEAKGEEPSDDTIKLAKEDGDWRIAALSSAST